MTTPTLDGAKRKLAPHWYLIYRSECAVCGKSKETRERMFTPRPDDPMARYKFHQYGCSEHFV